MTVNKSDLVKLVVEKTGIPKYKTKRMVDGLFDIMCDLLCNGDRIAVRGFGTWEVKTVKGHPLVHPATGERMMAEDYQNVVFRPGEELIRTVRGEEE